VSTAPTPRLRVTRYVDGEVLDVRTLTAHSTDVLGADDAAWAATVAETGRRFTIVIDDPDGDVPPVTLTGGSE
jgi:hypothetical protein